ncbi:hypothetical protein MWU57_09525 [Isoptericola sp. S6320L]|uniref:hypothetical protein n=1 Tax=Isoptericola sp. S6320L TaxID=2926411 RepID=UPI001FF6A3BD|nr:hypothetical protein [Isoptericola sp. S6320L]MCK0117273.1 hypothetical protein [Isoptericola sp. S6320L]
MGERLQLDLEAVRDTSARLRSIGRSLADAESAADDLAAMIPHRGLAGAVATFGKNWDVARTELIATLEGLQQAADGVADTFAEVDGELAVAVEGNR